MAATINLGASALASDGKTITAPISGGSAPYSITNASGITVNVGYRKYPVFSVAVVGTNLVIVLLLRVDAADAVTLDISTGSNLTDSASNTPTGQAAVSVTNESECERTPKPPFGKVLNLSGIADGIIAAYSFSEASGTSAASSLGTFPLTLANHWGSYRGVEGIKQIISAGDKLNISSSPVSKTADFAWQGEQAISIAVNVVITAHASGGTGIIGTGGDAFNWLTIGSDGVIRGLLNHTQFSSTSISGGNVALGEPFTAVLTGSAAGELRLYINGELVNSTALESLYLYGRFGLFNPNSPFGTSEDPSGYIGGAYIWDRVLTDAEIVQISEDPDAIYSIPSPAATAYTVDIKSRAYAGSRMAIQVLPTSGALNIGGAVTVTSSLGEEFILEIGEEYEISEYIIFTTAGDHVLTFTNDSGMTDVAPLVVKIHPGYANNWTPPALTPWGNLLDSPGNTYIEHFETGAKRPRHAFRAGDAITFDIPKAVNFGFDVTYTCSHYEVRDFTGAVVDSGSFSPSDDGLNTLTVSGVSAPGWYRLYLIDSAKNHETFGDYVGGFNFVIWPEGSALEDPGTTYLGIGDLPDGAALFSDTEETTISPTITATSAPLLVVMRGTFTPSASGTLAFDRSFQQSLRVFWNGALVLDGMNKYATIADPVMSVTLGESYEVVVERVVGFGQSLSALGLFPMPSDMTVWESPSGTPGKVQFQQWKLLHSDGEYQDDYLRALLGGAAGPQRFTIQHMTTIGDITQSLMIWKDYILGKDPVRPRKFILAFPDQGVGADPRTAADAAQFVSEVMALGFTTDQFAVECTNEPDLSYGSAAAWVSNVLIDFYTEMKAVDADIEVLAPCVVSIQSPTTGYIQAFLAAGGHNYCDSFSVHFYNCGQGDFALARKTLRDLRAHLTTYGVGSRKIYQTEQGDFTPMYGVYAVRHGVRWTMNRLLVMEQEGLPAEQNYYWYDVSHFWDFPMFLASEAGITPTAHAFRIYGSEVFGKSFTSAYDLGALDTIYLGSLYTGASASVAVFMSNGDPDGSVTLTVAGAVSLDVVSWDGVVTAYSVVDGQVTIPVPDIPTYVRLPTGTSLSPVIPALGSNLALDATVSDSHGSANLARLNNGLLEHNRYASAMGDQWYSRADMRTEDAWVQLDWETPIDINRVHIHCPAMFSHDSTMLNYALQYWNGSAWVDIEEAVETTPIVQAYMRESASKIEDFSRRKNVFQHEFSVVSTNKIRVHAYITTWGGNLTETVNDAGGQGWTPELALREIEVYNSADAVEPSGTPPAITSATTKSGKVGVSLSYTITATGTAPITFGASGLPAGLSVNTSTGAITGTPTTAGTVETTISATNDFGTDADQLTFTIAEIDAPVITSGTTGGGTINVAFEYQITATGSSITYGATGLPSGLSVNSSTGLISGTPTAPGESVITLSATNAGGSDTETLTLTFSRPALTGYTLTGPSSGRIGSARTFTVGVVPSDAAFGGSEVFTPVNTDLTGSFSAATVTPEAGSSSVLFQFTGNAESSGTIGVTDDQGWTDPAAIAFTVAAQSSSSGGGFRLRLGLGLGLGTGRGMGGIRPALTQWFEGGVAGKKVVWVGDSTTMQMFAAAGWDGELRFHERKGEILEGVTSVDFGSNGATTAVFIADGVVEKDLSAAIAEAGDLYLIRYGINDVRNGGSSAAILQAQLEIIVNAIREGVPSADIVLVTPNSLAAVDDGYISPNPLGNAQVYTNWLWSAYNALRGKWPNVTSIDLQSLVFGRVSPSTVGGLMDDSLHPSAAGYFALTAAIASVIGQERSPYDQALADAAVLADYISPWAVYLRACENTAYFDLVAEGRYVASGSGFIDFDWPAADATAIRNGDIVDVGGQGAALLSAGTASSASSTNTRLFQTPPVAGPVGRVRVWRHKYNRDSIYQADLQGGNVTEVVPCVLFAINGLIQMKLRDTNSPLTAGSGITDGDVLYVPGETPITLTGVTEHQGQPATFMTGDWSRLNDQYAIVARPL